MRFVIRCSLSLVAALAITLPAMLLHAQSADTAGLEVDVRDPTGAVVEGAKLQLISQSTHSIRDGVSDKEGRYRFVDVPVGSYTLSINREGFNEVVESGIELSVGQTSTLPVALKVLNGKEQVDVTSDVPMVDTNRTTTGETITTMEIENLPSNGRNFLDFALTVPGVTPQATSGQGSGISVNGQRSRSNNIMIDGVENNGDLNGTVRQTLSQDAISQFQVMTNQFLPEYGNAGGGLINVVTKSGTSQYHGDVFYFVRNAALNAHPYCFVVNCPAPIFVQNDVGGTLGGPIYKDKTFFFAAVEYLGLNTNEADNISALDAQGVNEILAIRPLVNGGVKSISTSNSIPLSTTQTLASLRIDHTFSEKNTLTFRALYAHYDHNNSNLDADDVPYSDVSNFGHDVLQAYNFTAIYTHVFTPNLLNEMHLQGSPQHLVQAPNDPTGPSLYFLDGLQIGRNNAFPTLLNENHFEITDSISWSKGNHLIKAGTDVDAVRAHTSYPTNFGGQFDFTCVWANTAVPGFPTAPAGATTCSDSLEAGQPYAYLQGFGNPQNVFPDYLYSGYVQDSWKIAPRLTLNYGIRYDFDEQPQGYNLNNSDPLEAPLPKGVPRDHNNFAPRVAIAWGVDRDSKTVLRAGYGIFYDKIFLLVARNALLAKESLNEDNNLPLTKAQFASGPFQNSSVYPSLSGAGIVPPVINALPSILPIPYAEQADLYLDRQLSKEWSIELGYIYVSGAKQLKSSNVNLKPPVIATSGTFQQIGRPYYSQGYVNPAYTGIEEVGSWGHSRYNGFQGSLIHNPTRNLTLRTSWVWSKEIDDASDFTQGQQPDNPFNPHAERSLGDEDQRNRFVLSSVYVFPYHRNVGSHSSALKWAFGDWVGSTISTVFSGSPQDLTVGSDVNNDQSFTDRPYIHGLNGLDGGYIVKRNDFRGPRQQNVTLRLQKRIVLTEAKRLEFSVESFNTFNHANFNGENILWGTGITPGANLIWGTAKKSQLGQFGAFNSTSSTSTTLPAQRELQLGAKFFF